MAQQKNIEQIIESLTNQFINREAPSSSSKVVMDQVLQCLMETDYQVEKLRVQADNAKTGPERMGCNLRVKALTILTARLQGVCGMNTNMPTDGEVAWAEKHFGLGQ